MCRKNHLHGCCMLAFGLGLIIGHCLESWFCFRGARGMKRVPRWYTASMLAFTLLVCVSTVLVKQHVLVDIPAAILVAELGLWLSDRFRAGRLLDRVEDARLRRGGGMM